MGGGSPHYDAPEPTPTKQATKSLSAGAQAAAQAQQDRAKRNKGLASSIVADRGAGGLSLSNVSGNVTLG